MSANQIHQPPNDQIIHWTNDTGAEVASGAVVRVGASRWGVARNVIAIAAMGAVALAGTFELPKLAGGGGTIFAQGAAVYWDTANNRVSTIPTDGTVLGYAYRAAANTDAVIWVTLDPVPTTFYTSRLATGGEATANSADFDTKFGVVPTFVQAYIKSTTNVPRLPATIQKLTAGSAGIIRITDADIVGTDTIEVFAIR